jgi:hypothetical protein
VLRAAVPRTSVISVPAYGQNVHSEHEVVLGGLAYRGWDAWSNKAPTHEAVPMASITPSTYDSEPNKPVVDKAAEEAYKKEIAPATAATVTVAKPKKKKKSA